MTKATTVAFLLLLVTACDKPANVSQGQTPGQAIPPVDPYEKTGGPNVTLPTETAVALPSGEFATIHPDPNRQAFVASFSELRQTLRGHVLYAPGRLEVVDTPRSAFPRTSPLWQDTMDSYMDDQVVGRIVMPSPKGPPYYLVHTDGMSGDPAFYVLRGSDGEVMGGASADVIALPATGDAWIYQRMNSVFPKRVRIHLANGRMDEVPSDQYPIGLQTVALKAFSLRRALDDSTTVAQVSAGDSLEVVAGIDPPRSESVLLVRTRAGAEGWVKVPSQQCNFGVIKGICFLGD